MSTGQRVWGGGGQETVTSSRLNSTALAEDGGLGSAWAVLVFGRCLLDLGRIFPNTGFFLRFWRSRTALSKSPDTFGRVLYPYSSSRRVGGGRI